MELQGQKLAGTSVQNVLLVTLFFGQPGAKVRHACFAAGKFFRADFAMQSGPKDSMSDVQAWMRCHCGSTLVIGEVTKECKKQNCQLKEFSKKRDVTHWHKLSQIPAFPANPSSWIWSRLGWPLSFEWRDHVHLGLKTLSKLASRGRMSSLAIQSTLLEAFGDDPIWRAYFSDGLVQPPTSTLLGTNISPKNGILKMIFLFPRWDMLIPWRVHEKDCYLADSPTFPVPFGVRRKALPDLIKRSQQGRAGASIQRKAKDLLMIY